MKIEATLITPDFRDSESTAQTMEAEGLDCAIAGIPVADFSRILLTHAPLTVQRGLEARGVEQAALRDVLRPVSPLALDPRVPAAGRAVFGGVVDRIVSPDHPRDLIAHWSTPRHRWYPGGHLTFRLDRGVQRLIREVLVARLGARGDGPSGPAVGDP